MSKARLFSTFVFILQLLPSYVKLHIVYYNTNHIKLQQFHVNLKKYYHCVQMNVIFDTFKICKAKKLYKKHKVCNED